LAIVATTASASYPVWCVCDTGPRSSYPCAAAMGNYDGGSCGLDTPKKCLNFQRSCSASKLPYHCWDGNNSPTGC
ncbi:hypothetical protein BGZ83_003587, partial [Gryganskiella cystojenkinii]